MRRALLVLVVLLGLVSSSSAQESGSYDVVIRGGRVLDGTGNPFFHADVAIDDGRIVFIGNVPDTPAERTIDARGLYVSPGFIDMHSHAMNALHDPELRLDRQSLTQGIVTALLNPDGGNLWPIGEHQMTSLPASVLRLPDRGLLREGYRADVTIFDPVTIRNRSTYTRPHVWSEGIRYVLINGKLAVDFGEPTGALAGEVLTPRASSQPSSR